VSEHLVVSAVFKTAEPEHLGLAGSIPVHLRDSGCAGALAPPHRAVEAPAVDTEAAGSLRQKKAEWDAMTVMTRRLTSYAHRGGCACKIAPGELERMVAGLLVTPPANAEARRWSASTMATMRRSSR
jgi:hypothetical protein